PRVARGVPDRVLDLRIELVDPAARVEEKPGDDRGADDPGAGDERGPTIHPAHLPETGEEPAAAAAIRLASRPLRHSGQKIDFDHGLPLVRAHACRSARPTGSISMGASSSMLTDCMTSGRTATRLSGLASSVLVPRRVPSASTSPGIPAPPPATKTLPMSNPPE